MKKPKSRSDVVREAYRIGVRAAAETIQSLGWEHSVANTDYYLSDIVLMKFNLTKKLRRRKLSVEDLDRMIKWAKEKRQKLLNKQYGKVGRSGR